MFDRDTLTRKSINGENYITFKPNTITYAVPENSDLGKQMSTAQVGIIFHTNYTGDTIANLKAQYGVGFKSYIVFSIDSSHQTQYQMCKIPFLLIFLNI